MKIIFSPYNSDIFVVSWFLSLKVTSDEYFIHWILYFYLILIFSDMCNSYQCTSDSLEHLAPFVAEEDIMQLNSEPFPIDISFPELDLSGYSLDTTFGKQIQVNIYKDYYL